MFVEKVWRFYSVEQLFSIFSGAFYMNLFRKKKRYLKGRDTQKGERDRDRGNENLHLLVHRWLCTSTWGIFCCFSGTVSGSWTRSRAGRTWTSAPMGRCFHRWQLSLLCQGAAPSFLHLICINLAFLHLLKFTLNNFVVCHHKKYIKID